MSAARPVSAEPVSREVMDAPLPSVTVGKMDWADFAAFVAALPNSSHRTGKCHRGPQFVAAIRRVAQEGKDLMTGGGDGESRVRTLFKDAMEGRRVRLSPKAIEQEVRRAFPLRLGDEYDDRVVWKHVKDFLESVCHSRKLRGFVVLFAVTAHCQYDR